MRLKRNHKVYLGKTIIAAMDLNVMLPLTDIEIIALINWKTA